MYVNFYLSSSPILCTISLFLNFSALQSMKKNRDDQFSEQEQQQGFYKMVEDADKSVESEI